jgi:hypothetical protein
MSLRRVQLPSGVIDGEVSLDGILNEQQRGLLGRGRSCLVAAWKDLVVLNLYDVSGGPSRAELVAIDLATGERLWSTSVGSASTVAFQAPDGEVFVVELLSSFLVKPGDVKRISSTAGSGPVLEIELATGDKRLNAGAVDPASLLSWHGATGRNPLVVVHGQTLWAIVSGGVRPEFLRIDLATGDLVWRTSATGIDDESRLAIHDPDDVPGFFVVAQLDTVHVFDRETGARIGTISLDDVGATRHPYKRPAPETALPSPTRAARILMSHWWDHLWLALFALPLGWLVWRLVRRRPVA